MHAAKLRLQSLQERRETKVEAFERLKFFQVLKERSGISCDSIIVVRSTRDRSGSLVFTSRRILGEERRRGDCGLSDVHINTHQPLDQQGVARGLILSVEKSRDKESRHISGYRDVGNRDIGNPVDMRSGNFRVKTLIQS